MARYQKYMQGIHNAGRAYDIEKGAKVLIEDVCDLLIKSGVRPDCALLDKIKQLQKYEYGRGFFSSNNKH